MCLSGLSRVASLVASCLVHIATGLQCRVPPPPAAPGSKLVVAALGERLQDAHAGEQLKDHDAERSHAGDGKGGRASRALHRFMGR